MVLIFPKKKVDYFALNSNLEENCKINVLEIMICEAIFRRRNGDYQASMCSFKMLYKIITFSFSERITRPAQQKVIHIMILEFSKPFDITSSGHAGEIGAGQVYN